MAAFVMPWVRRYSIPGRKRRARELRLSSHVWKTSSEVTVTETHTSPHPGTVPEKQPPTIQARTRRRRRITRAGLAVGISVATLILSRSSEQRAHGSDQQSQQTQAANATSNEAPLKAAPVLNPPKAPSS